MLGNGKGEILAYLLGTKVKMRKITKIVVDYLALLLEYGVPYVLAIC